MNQYLNTRALIGLAMVLSLAISPRVFAQCDYLELESDAPVDVSQVSGPQYFQLIQTDPGWMAIGCRPSTSVVGELLTYDSDAPHPSCVTSPLWTDNFDTQVGLVVGNCTQARTGDYFGILNGVWDPAVGTLEWDEGNGTLTVNDTLMVVEMAADDVVDIWDVYLSAGVEYSFWPTGGSAEGIKLLLFEPTSVPHFVDRSMAVIEKESTGHVTYYTPAVSGVHGVVIVKDTDLPATYGLAVGRCVDPVPMSKGVPLILYSHQNYFRFEQVEPGWSVVGGQSPGSSQMLGLYDSPNPHPYPYCFEDLLSGVGASFAPLAVRYFVSGDVITPETDYLRVQRGSGGLHHETEWDRESGEIAVNGPPMVIEAGSSNIVDVWNVSLTTGETYTFNFSKVGAVDPKLFLFERKDDVWMSHQGDPVYQNWGEGQYTAAKTEGHGLVLVNTNGQPGSYTVAVSTCSSAVYLWGENRLFPTPPGENSARFSFRQRDRQWSGVALAGTANWDLDIYEYPSGGAEPLCFSNPLAQSTETGSPPPMDFVVGDFNRNPLGEYYAHCRYSTGSFTEADLCWDSGRGSLEPSSNEFGWMPDGDLIDVWDAPLMAGHDYQVHFLQTSGIGTLKLFIFEPSGDTYWAGRASNLQEVTSSTAITPAFTGDFGFVIINEDGGDAGYELGISAATLPVENGATPSIARIRALVPNPSGGALAIHFGLPSPQSVSFDVVDVAGRVVSSVPSESWDAGWWAYTWNGLSSRGSRPPTGVYFVRMKTMNGEVSQKKFVLIK